MLCLRCRVRGFPWREVGLPGVRLLGSFSARALAEPGRALVAGSCSGARGARFFRATMLLRCAPLALLSALQAARAERRRVLARDSTVHARSGPFLQNVLPRVAPRGRATSATEARQRESARERREGQKGAGRVPEPQRDLMLRSTSMLVDGL